MNAAKTQVTKIVAGFVVDCSAPTVFEATAPAPSSRAPKAFDKATKIASIKALCAARMAAFLAQ